MTNDVSGPMTPPHAIELARILQQKFPGRELSGVEVGAAQGLTSAYLLKELSDLRMTLVDCWCSFDRNGRYSRSGDRNSRLSDDEQRHRFNEAKARTGFAGARCQLSRAWSSEAAELAEPESVDFIFVDADHSLDAVAEDLRIWWPAIKPGGIVAGKDYGHRRDKIGAWGISRAVHTFAASHNLQVYCEGARVWRIHKPERQQSEDDWHAVIAPKLKKPANNRESSLAVCAAFFNPAKYKRLITNYRRFRDKLDRQNVNPWIVEIAFGNDEFVLPTAEVALQLRSNSTLWQKEAALNVMFRSLPEHFDKVAWIDADLIFEDDDWLHRVARALDQFPVVQCFSEASLSGSDGAATFPARSSLARALAERHPYRSNFGFSHPGFAWAARRGWLMSGGLFEDHVTGGSDALMAIAWLNLWDHPHLRRLNSSLTQSLKRWRRNFEDGGADVGLGFVDGRIQHLWHGEEKDRLYAERLGYLTCHDFSPDADLVRNESGLLEWADSDCGLSQQVEDYFRLRKDDG